MDNDEKAKKTALFLKQKALLDTFLEKKAISKAQYDKSFGDLTVKMGMEEVVKALEARERADGKEA